MAEMLNEIMKLSIAERILLVEAIWDSIPNEGDNSDLSPKAKRLLDQRLAAHTANPEAGSSWEDVKARLQAK
jgi:putative addiction module component (TIGR02574 family)